MDAFEAVAERPSRSTTEERDRALDHVLASTISGQEQIKAVIQVDVSQQILRRQSGEIQKHARLALILIVFAPEVLTKRLYRTHIVPAGTKYCAAFQNRLLRPPNDDPESFVTQAADLLASGSQNAINRGVRMAA
jgi:hypothetical protein